MKLNEGGGKLCTWGGTTPFTNTYWELAGLKAALQKRTWGLLEQGAGPNALQLSLPTSTTLGFCGHFR